jgi:tripartite-type tricarboxylate transporter receptor subunit TctC
MHLRRLIAAALFALLTIPGQAAEQFPAREITLVVPLTPGTTIDILARLYADKLGKLLGQQIVVMNRPGAGGIVGAESVATAAPDGYTLLFGNSGHSILGLLNKNLAFDPIKDFAGVAMIGAAPAIVVVPSALGVADLNAFIALAKAKPGQLNYGSAGVGTATHLAGAYFAARTDLKIVHVPYTVSSNIISDMLSGAIQASFDPLAFVLSFLQNGSLRALAVGADEPVTDPVKIPTAISQGVDYHFATWYGILAPSAEDQGAGDQARHRRA